MTTTLIEDMESVIDGASVADVLAAIADVCNLKAMHIEDSWQDRALAKQWKRAALEVGKACDRCTRTGTPGIEPRRS